ncbi:crosslink repair DNA glycosylase YcaQ family protein [Cellulosimicrobium sp. PMB13]|uniref:DNA glycosylase AlkZ-like family protein n=1 Tax=Cellulosimicrobium sp. PMB13 TaxID=3120158 RepID=UPI003F4C9750
MTRNAPASRTDAPLRVTRAAVLAFRRHAQELDRDAGSARSALDAAVLDLGVQDTGPDGARWALELRGAPPAAPGDLALAWTLRGAPHVYRRTDLASVAVATAPLSEADAAKRVYDASRPLRAAGISVLDALRTVAEDERSIVTAPTVKGDLSTRLTERLDEPFLRWCRPCGATHSYEMTFRLAALQAGLELEPGTSPPVLQRAAELDAPLYGRLADEADPRLDVVRGYLRLLGPASVQDVAAFLDAPVRDVRAAWPEDAVAVDVVDGDASGEGRRAQRWVLADDADALADAADGLSDGASRVRLLGPYDLYLQLRDRRLLVPDASRAQDLWRTLGRPGAVLAGSEVVGTWRPRASGRRLTVVTDPWTAWDAALDAAVVAQAERLAAFRGASTVDVGRAD